MQFIYVFIQVLKPNFEDIVLIPKILQHFFRLKTTHFTLQIFPFARSVTWKQGKEEEMSEGIIFVSATLSVYEIHIADVLKETGVKMN